MINIQSEKHHFLTKDKNNLFFNNIFEYLEKNKYIQSKKIYLMVLFKFYLWLKFNKNENIFNSESNINLDEYFYFLKDPQPKNIFTGYKLKINDINWKPFNNGLTINSINQHLNIIKKFLKYYNINYKSEIKKIKNSNNNDYYLNEIYLERIIQHIEQKMFNETHNALSKKNRLKWVIILLFFTGVKVKDIFDIKMKDVKKENKDYYIDIFNKNRINRIKLSKFFIDEFLKYKKQYGKKQLIDKSESSLILSLSGQIDIKLNTIQKEFIKLKNSILEDDEYKSDFNFIKCIQSLSLIKIREYAIFKLINDNNVNKLELKNFFNLDEQTYKKYLHRFEMNKNLGF